MPSPERPATEHHDDLPAREPVLGLSPAQVAGSALAAVSGACLAAWLGVTGTLVGAALGSVVGTVGSASYTYSLQRGHGAVRGLPLLADATGRTPRRGLPWPPLPWSRLTVAGAVVMALGLGTLTLVEGLAGAPVSSLATGGHRGGTTIGQAVSHATSSGGAPHGHQPAPSQSPAPTQGPSPTGTPSPSPSGAPTEPSPSPSGTPSSSPSPTDSGTPAP